MPWGLTFLPVSLDRSSGVLAVSRYAITRALYSLFGQRFNNLTSARPIRTNRPRAQVAELVDALASGASGLTAVKVRGLSWAPHQGVDRSADRESIRPLALKMQGGHAVGHTGRTA